MNIRIKTTVFVLLLALVPTLLGQKKPSPLRGSVGSGPSGELPVVVDEDFERGMDRWTTTDRQQEKKMWSIVPHPASTPGDLKNSVFRVAGASSFQPPHRSPHSVALLKDLVVSSFQLTADVQNTNSAAGNHRDLCFFWGYQDPKHFYYVHLGAKADPHSCQVFIVNDAPRTKISQLEAEGIPWTDGWHKVKVRHDTQTGLIEVFFDDMESPTMTAVDKTFLWGRVGIGTFDDHGNFDNVQLRAQVLPIPVEAAYP